MSKAILVTGATGKQGGSVVKALVKAAVNFEILALTRDVKSASAQRLAAQSPKIKLISGNLDDPEAIFESIPRVTNVPVWGVFSVQTIGGEGAEERQGNILIDAALKHGVKHFVYSSVDRGGSKSDDTPTNVPHFITKHNIEQHLISSTKDKSMTWTILRPVGFFENLVPGFMGKVFTTCWETTLRRDRQLQLIATSDIAFFAGEAFTKYNDQAYKNQKISIAGDELTFTQFQTIFKENTGQTLPTTYGFVAAIIKYMVKELGYMFKWFDDAGYGADIPALKKINPSLKDFGTWLREESQFMKR